MAEIQDGGIQDGYHCYTGQECLIRTRLIRSST